MLGKIHKANNPGRPIVSACDGPTEKLSQFIDYHIKGLAQMVDLYIKDTNDFIWKLHKLGPVPKQSLLVTIDISALYTSIPHKDDIAALKEASDKCLNQEPKTWIILQLMLFVLRKTCFKFNEKFYEHISGKTMGIKCAPSYAILFMGLRIQIPQNPEIETFSLVDIYI